MVSWHEDETAAVEPQLSREAARKRSPSLNSVGLPDSAMSPVTATRSMREPFAKLPRAALRSLKKAFPSFARSSPLKRLWVPKWRSDRCRMSMLPLVSAGWTGDEGAILA